MRLVITYYRQNFFNIIFHSYLSTKCHEISHNLLSIYFFFNIIFYSYLSTKCYEISHNLLSTES